MHNVTVETRLSIALTAEQWQLYHVPGRDHAAYALNAAITGQLNGARNGDEAYKDGLAVLRQYTRYGASDSEPEFVLKQLVRLRFPNWRD